MKQENPVSCQLSGDIRRTFEYRNLVEINITAGITLYTDHKPGLFENSISNKVQLSAWRLLETADLLTADLLSIVENLYRTGEVQKPH